MNSFTTPPSSMCCPVPAFCHWWVAVRGHAPSHGLRRRFPCVEDVDNSKVGSRPCFFGVLSMPHLMCGDIDQTEGSCSSSKCLGEERRVLWCWMRRYGWSTRHGALVKRGLGLFGPTVCTREDLATIGTPCHGFGGEGEEAKYLHTFTDRNLGPYAPPRAPSWPCAATAARRPGLRPRSHQRATLPWPRCRRLQA